MGGRGSCAAQLPVLFPPKGFLEASSQFAFLPLPLCVCFLNIIWTPLIVLVLHASRWPGDTPSLPVAGGWAGSLHSGLRAPALQMTSLHSRGLSVFAAWTPTAHPSGLLSPSGSQVMYR